MRYRTRVLSAVTISLVAALGLVGCGDPPPGAAPQNMPNASGAGLPTPPAGPLLPPPDALAAVLYQLADPSIPAERKVSLVQYATVDDQAALTNFGEALGASGFTPLAIQATDLTWAADPGYVTANVTVGSPDPTVKAFTYPMEFSPGRDSWQLSRRTADQLLPLAEAAPPKG